MGRQYNLESGFLFHKDWEKTLRRLSPEKFHFVFWGLYDYQRSGGAKQIAPHPDDPHVDDIIDLLIPKIIDRLNGAKGGKKTQSNKGCVGGVSSREELSEEELSEVRGTRARGRYGNVYMTESQYNELKEKFGESITDDYVERLSKYIADSGKKYASHYNTIQTWIQEDKPQSTLPSSFDVDDFFNRAVEKTLGGI